MFEASGLRISRQALWHYLSKEHTSTWLLEVTENYKSLKTEIFQLLGVTTVIRSVAGACPDIPPGKGTLCPDA